MKRAACLLLCICLLFVCGCRKQIPNESTVSHKTTASITTTTASTTATTTTPATGERFSPTEPTTQTKTSTVVTTTKTTTVTTTKKSATTTTATKPATAAKSTTTTTTKLTTTTSAKKQTDTVTTTSSSQHDPHVGQIEYILPDGSHVWVDETITDVTAYYMAQKTQPTEHLYHDAEQEIVRLCNIEREKEGLQPLEWFEDAHYFAKIRAEEAKEEFSHTRPNGKDWHSVYFDAGVIIDGGCGENLYTTAGEAHAEWFAARAVKGWMNSPGHRSNIMNPNFTRITVAVIGPERNSYGIHQLLAVQHFFS